MIVLLEDYPKELWSSVRLNIGFLVNSLTKAILPRMLSLARWAALGSLVGSKLLPIKNGSHCVVGDLQYCRNVFGTLSRSVPQHNPVSALYGQFL